MTNEPVYYYSFECEHSGDIARQVDELCAGGATIVDVETVGEGYDRDYTATVYFTVADHDKFKEELGWDAREDCNVKTW